MRISTIITLLLGAMITTLSSLFLLGVEEFIESLPYIGVIAGLFILYVGFIRWLYEVA